MNKLTGKDAGIGTELIFRSERVPVSALKFGEKTIYHYVVNEYARCF